MAKTTKNFADVIRAELEADPELAKAVDEERLHADIATQIYQLRAQAKLTQKDLADRAGTKQSVISRIEDADYDGHSLKTLHRIACAFDKRVVVVFCPAESVSSVLAYAAVAATNTVVNVALDFSQKMHGAYTGSSLDKPLVLSGSKPLVLSGS
jgi:transcriptional regulator with XRE-family HTH domain